MKLLLDTCTFLWIITGDASLSPSARKLFSDPANEVFLSSVSAWEIALKHTQKPSILVLSRQAVTNVRTTPTAENLSAKGAYVLWQSAPDKTPDLILIASGSEVSLALQAEGRNSVESDWLLISSYPDFPQGFAAIAVVAAVAGWGDWQLIADTPARQECLFRLR